MNRLSTEQRARILHLLCEGISIRAVTRLTEASKNTVTKLLIDTGKACSAFHDANVRNVKAKRVQVDEIWSFAYTKRVNLADDVAAPEDAGETWTWTATDADSKLIVSHFVGRRDAECAMWFLDDLAARIGNRVTLASNGHGVYLEAIEEAFSADVDHALLVRIYGASPDEAKGRYSPADWTGIRDNRIMGDRGVDHVSMSDAERSVSTMRLHRFARLTKEFSKKVENHAYMVALHVMHYNFMRIHETLDVSPAMAAGVTARLWKIADVVKLVEDAEASPAKRGACKKRKRDG